MNRNKFFIVALAVVLILGVFGYSQFGRKPSVKEPMTGSTEQVAVQPAANYSEVPQIEYKDITPQQAVELIEYNPDLVIIDVSPNYAQGHLPRAVNYYVGDGSLDTAIPTLDMSKTYLVYCHADSASIAGAQKLVDAGFSKVYRLQGNYAGWVEAGFPIEMPSN